LGGIKSGKGIKFLFLDAKCMSKVVGARLEWAKVLVIDDSVVEIIFIC
jgi:hypothetical protein